MVKKMWSRFVEPPYNVEFEDDSKTNCVHNLFTTLGGFYELSEFANGGGVSKSAVKLHLEFDLLTGTFINLEVSIGTKNDMDYGWDILNIIKKNDLCIRDLGYYSSLHFKKLTEKGSYYISKIKSNTKIYSYDEKYSKFSATEYKKGELFEIDIAKISETLTPNETFELADILIGKTHLCKNRLIITKLSEQIKQEREEKRKANAKKNKVKKSISTLDGLNAYITNIPNETLVQGMFTSYMQQGGR